MALVLVVQIARKTDSGYDRIAGTAVLRTQSFQGGCFRICAPLTAVISGILRATSRNFCDTPLAPNDWSDWVDENAVSWSFVQSLVWFAVFMALMAVERDLVSQLFIDFVHSNPHRTKESVISMMKWSALILGTLKLIETFLVFTVPQFFQVGVVEALDRRFGDRARFGALLVLPVTAVLTWYCYDYLTPSNLCFAGNCGEPYEHGISMSRYMIAVQNQAPLTLFSFLYFDAGWRGQSRRSVLFATVGVVLIIGAIQGYLDARGQLRFLNDCRPTGCKHFELARRSIVGRPPHEARHS